MIIYEKKTTVIFGIGDENLFFSPDMFDCCGEKLSFKEEEVDGYDYLLPDNGSVWLEEWLEPEEAVKKAIREIAISEILEKWQLEKTDIKIIEFRENRSFYDDLETEFEELECKCLNLEEDKRELRHTIEKMEKEVEALKTENSKLIEQIIALNQKHS